MHHQLGEVQGWIYTRGCTKGFEEWLSKHEYMILFTSCVVMFMQVSQYENKHAGFSLHQLL